MRHHEKSSGFCGAEEENGLLDYFLQIKVDYFVNLAECGLVVYWNIFQNLRSCPRKVLEKVLESP